MADVQHVQTVRMEDGGGQRFEIEADSSGLWIRPIFGGRPNVSLTPSLARQVAAHLLAWASTGSVVIPDGYEPCMVKREAEGADRADEARS